MQTRKAAGLSERDPIAMNKHAREGLWQITLPIMFTALVVLVIAFLSTGLGGLDASRWGSISLIWLIIPAMLAILIGILILIAGIFAVVKISQAIPGAAFRIMQAISRAGAMTRMAGDRVAAPFMRAHSISAGVRSLARQILRK